MKRRVAIALSGWLAFVAVCAAFVGQLRFTADLSAFLPATPTPEQQVLVDQLRDGMVSRLLLVGIEGGDAEQRAAASKALARLLRADAAFGTVENGEPVNRERDQALLFEHRYLLSPAVTPELFTAAGLRDAIGESLDLLASPLGLLTKSLLPRDPTGETVRLLEQAASGAAPASIDGAWASRDGKRALLLAQTRAAGSDLDAQQEAIAKIRAAFAAALTEVAAPGLRLLISGPGKFAVDSRATIEDEVLRLALVSTALIVALLLFIYRSPTALVLGLLPVATGALAGIVAVGLGFGVVHGVTLGFGATLIGEAVDYAIYVLVQSGRGDRPQGSQSLWRTIRLGVLTSICGFAALMFSGFPGLAQLGLYSVAGLVTAALATRFVLPQLLPRAFRIRDVAPLGEPCRAVLDAARRLRPALAVVAVAAAGVVVTHGGDLWNRELASLSPVAAEDQALDLALRSDLGAPDVRYLIVLDGDDREAVLAAAGVLGERLQPLVNDGTIGGFDSPARFLPAQSIQLARRESLPQPDVLAARVAQATDGLPLRAERLAPFVADVTAARERPLLTRTDLDGTSFALAVDSLLVEQRGRWNALIPLRAATRGAHAHEVPVELVRAAIADVPGRALLIDMKGESDRLYADYLREAVLLALAGVGAIVVLLAFALRSAVRVLRVLAPLAAAVLVVVAGLVLAGVALTILHLVGLLLIVAVGSNYALFFDGDTAPSSQTLASMLFANLTTVAGFGVLAFSSVPVLQAIGATVGPGAVLALAFAAILAPPQAQSR